MIIFFREWRMEWNRMEWYGMDGAGQAKTATYEQAAYNMGVPQGRIRQDGVLTAREA
jgi:hypothetical protein